MVKKFLLTFFLVGFLFATHYAPVLAQTTVIATDYSSIQEAIDQLQSTGGTVVLPAGNYTIESGLRLPNNTTLKGAGSGNTTIHNRATSPTYMVINAGFGGQGNEDITVEGIRFDGNRDQFTSAGGLYFQNVQNLTLRDIEVVNTGNIPGKYQGISLVNLTNAQLMDIYVDNHGVTDEHDSNIYINFGSGYHLNRITSTNAKGSGAGTGLLLIDYFATDVTVENFVGSNSEGDGIKILGNHVKVELAQISQNKAAGIAVISTHHVTLESISVSENDGNGIEIANDPGWEILGLRNTTSDIALSDISSLNNGQRVTDALNGIAIGNGTFVENTFMNNISVSDAVLSDIQAVPTQEYGLRVLMGTHNNFNFTNISGSGNKIALSNYPLESPPLTGDLNGDGIVDLFDYSILVSQFLQEGPNLTADLNQDNLVDLSDYSILVANFLKTGP